MPRRSVSLELKLSEDLKLSSVMVKSISFTLTDLSAALDLDLDILAEL